MHKRSTNDWHPFQLSFRWAGLYYLTPPKDLLYFTEKGVSTKENICRHTHAQMKHKRLTPLLTLTLNGRDCVTQAPPKDLLEEICGSTIMHEAQTINTFFNPHFQSNIFFFNFSIFLLISDVISTFEKIFVIRIFFIFMHEFWNFLSSLPGSRKLWKKRQGWFLGVFLELFFVIFPIKNQ